jgi:membrane associated rhomboid family serine protease
LIPLTDHNPTRRFPVVCVTLIILNALVFLIDQLSPVVFEYVTQRHGVPVRVQDSMGRLSFQYSLIPAYVTGQTPEISGRPLFPQVLQPAWLTIFTSMFLHANWLHVGGNMLYLWIFGNNIEDVLGRVRFIVFYLLCGIGAAVVHIASDPNSAIPTVGASGAVAGLMGAYLLLYPAARILSIVPICGIIGTLVELPAVLVIGFWIVLQVLNSQFMGGDMLAKGGGVAYLAHIGGFAMGMILILLCGGRRLLPPPEPAGFDEGYTPRRWSGRD